MLEEKEIGKNIRRLRKAAGYSLEVLAKEIGMSKGYLSKLENSPKSPPLSTLIVIAEALGATLSEILGENQEQRSASLVKVGDRKPMARNGTFFGYSYETLAHNYPHKRMEPYLLTIPSSNTKSAVFKHRGEEMMMVLQGTMHFTHGTDEYLVEEGDCIYFDSGVEHFGVAVSEQDVKCLMVIFVP
ncbi:MAG: XRE family transcriptional regulator [Desulfarculaceae bacterium]|nr:XRE family transcriptional regulator [Desulfarculaceae bacterium]MCF8070750.1 XRE family transcriptional regulator [Desulfarculaceae bacterium]MCF8102187.1 XRE family transcriptional regulator [Desulfarculaceae bacterium]MCF8117014.1 XRE family transcriptional regulator [Desulfarculaceae bacterium]